MKLLLNVHCTNEYLDCPHFLVAFPDSEQINALRRLRAEALEFLATLNARHAAGHVAVKFPGELVAGTCDLEAMPEVEKLIQDQAWAMVPDTTLIPGEHSTPLEFIEMRVFPGGNAYVTACVNRSSRHLQVEAQLFDEAINALAEQANLAADERQIPLTPETFRDKFPNQAERNKNCLADMACPECGSREPFTIEVTCFARTYDDGIEQTEDSDWSALSACACRNCGYDATVQHFIVTGLDQHLQTYVKQNQENESSPPQPPG